MDTRELYKFPIPRRENVALIVNVFASIAFPLFFNIFAFNRPLYIPFISSDRWGMLIGSIVIVWLNIASYYANGIAYSHRRPSIRWTEWLFAPIYMLIKISSIARTIAITVTVAIISLVLAVSRDEWDGMFELYVFIGFLAASSSACAIVHAFQNYMLVPATYVVGHMRKPGEHIYPLGMVRMSTEGEQVVDALVIPDDSDIFIDSGGDNKSVFISSDRGRIESAVIPQIITPLQIIVRPFAFLWDWHPYVYDWWDKVLTKHTNDFVARAMAQSDNSTSV